MPPWPGSNPRPLKPSGRFSRRRLSDHRLPEACKLACRLCLALSRIRVHWGGAEPWSGPAVAARCRRARSHGPTVAAHRGQVLTRRGRVAHTAGVAPPPHARVGVCHECRNRAPHGRVVPAVPAWGGGWRSGRSGQASSGGSASDVRGAAWVQRGTRVPHTRRAARRRGASGWEPRQRCCAADRRDGVSACAAARACARRAA